MFWISYIFVKSKEKWYRIIQLFTLLTRSPEDYKGDDNTFAWGLEFFEKIKTVKA